MFKYSATNRLLFLLRDLTARPLFSALGENVKGDVLDVGGASFFLTAVKRGVQFKSWTTIEPTTHSQLTIQDPRYRFVEGDGCAMPFPENSFDVVLNIQVLEHTFEPFKMFAEMVRVLKPGGCLIVYAPQTGVMHLAPYHFQNFLRFWFEEAAHRTGMKVQSLKPVGGWWKSMASRSIYFFMAAFRRKGSSVPECQRPLLFYLLFPFMALYSLISFPVLMLFSFGDLTEDPNNHLIIFRKPL